MSASELLEQASAVRGGTAPQDLEEAAVATAPEQQLHNDQEEAIAAAARRLYRGQLLAPMVRASTTPLRTLALHYGADAVYTEELVDQSLLHCVRQENKQLGTVDYVKRHGQNQQQGKKKKKKKHQNKHPPVLLRIDPALERDRLICQLGTANDVTAVPAAQVVCRDVAAMDVNMGCPRKFSLSGGMGAALLQDPDRACRIVRALRNHIHKPISAKIRLLTDENKERSVAKTCEFIQGLVEAGRVHAVAVHGRAVRDQEKDPADWATLIQVIQQCKQRFPHVQFLINGDFYTRREITETMKASGADGVLLARPALYNTSLFRKPPTGAGSTTATDYGYDSPLLLSKTKVVQDYLARAVRYQMPHQNTKYVVCEMMSPRRHPTERVPYLPQQFGLGGSDNKDLTISSVCQCKSLDDLCRLWQVDTSTATTTRAAPAGEHRYDDAYFLGRTSTATTTNGASTWRPPAKQGILRDLPTTASLPLSSFDHPPSPTDYATSQQGAKRPRIESSSG